jgi:signal transduction histidine kinase
LEREVAHRTAELRRRNAEIEEFVQIVTHDLKNLSVGAAETARKLLEAEGRRLSARGQRYAEHLIVDTRMMNQMLRHVLSLFRADSEELKEGEVDLDAIVREALRAYEERIEAKGIRVSVAPLGKVRGDADRIRHVVANLLDNAVKFTGDKSPPEIRVFCRRGPEGMEVVVADNGVGIGEEEREKIFRLYHRGSIKGAPGVDPSGDGVGLAISKRLVERWGGRIWADSVVGQGSEFHFTIPAASGIEQGGGDDESVKRA